MAFAPLRLLLALIILAATGTGVAGEAAPTSGTGEAISVHIVEPLDWTPSPEPCEAPDAPWDCEWNHEPWHDVVYRFHETLRGTAREGELTVRVPSLYRESGTETRWVLLILGAGADGAIAVVGAHAADRLEDGTWAVCGKPFSDKGQDEDRVVRPMRFEGVFGDASRLSAAGRRERFVDGLVAGDHVAEGDVARCIRGVTIDDIVAFDLDEARP